MFMIGVIIVICLIFYISFIQNKKIMASRKLFIENLLDRQIDSNIDDYPILNNITSIYGSDDMISQSSIKRDVRGTYIIINERNESIYVGQSINCYKRSREHLCSRGNHDISYDIKNGDKFIIAIIQYDSSLFKSLNEQEKYLITFFNSYHKGYNGTRGNRG